MNTQYFDVQSDQLARLITNTLPFVSKDETLPALRHVQFSRAGDTVTAAATDRYALATDTATVVGEPGECEFILHADSLASLLKDLKAIKPRPVPIRITKKDDGTIGVALLDGERRLIPGDCDFPRWRSLLPSRDDAASAKGVIEFAFNPALVAKFAKVDSGSKSAPMRILGMAASRPFRVEIGDTFVAIIMPIRIENPLAPVGACTEKIDGTNGLISINHYPEADRSIEREAEAGCNLVWVGDDLYTVSAGSRSRWLDPDSGQDNFGFGRWVADNAAVLAETLGAGYHYGEWWGQGIQRTYGRHSRSFSLFNSHRWEGLAKPINETAMLSVVPILYRGRFETEFVDDCLADLIANGSKAMPFYERPEGVVVYHSASRQSYKALIENDGQPKGEVA